MDNFFDGRLELWKFGIELLKLAATAVVAVYIGILGRTRYNADQHRQHEKAVDKRLDVIEKDVTRHDERLRQLPEPGVQSSSVSRAHKRIDELSDRTSRIDGELSGVKSSLGRVNEYLLNRKG